jgi:molecular chaperone DnaK (HSP70)
MCSIGIDLGTTCARVAIWQDNGVKILSSESGDKKIPCFVSFTEKYSLIGEPAKKKVRARALTMLKYVL